MQYYTGKSTWRHCYDAQLSFVELFSGYPQLFEKLNVPAAKNVKNAATQEFLEQWNQISGEEMAMGTFRKKLNNKKTRVKSSADKNKTGNKKIVLKQWEEKLLNIIHILLELNKILAISSRF